MSFLVSIYINFILSRVQHHRIHILLQAPRICPYSYQTGSYSITIYDAMNQTVVLLGPTEYTQMNESEQILITKEFRTELAQDQYYTVEVVVESIGAVRVKRKIISMY